jgi:tryptophan synthase beta chain
VTSRNQETVFKGGNLPTASAGIAERTTHDPDAGGHFGVYGGRHVPEALMAVIEEVTAEYEIDLAPSA